MVPNRHKSRQINDILDQNKFYRLMKLLLKSHVELIDFHYFT